MGSIKVTLNRQIGPFKVWQWLVVVIAGVGIGLLVRRRFAMGNDYSGTSLDSSTPIEPSDNLPGTQGAPTIVNSPDFDSMRALQQNFDRFQDEIDQRFKDDQTQDNKLFTEIKKRLDAIKIPVTPRTPPANVGGGSGNPVPKPKPKPVATKPKPKPQTPPATKPKVTAKTYTVVKGDTLWKIAARFGYSHWSPIYNANRNVIGGNPDLIRPGQKLILPPK